GNIQKIKTQIEHLKTDFQVVYDDPLFTDLLYEFFDEKTANGYLKKISDILAILNKIELSTVSEKILPDDPDYENLMQLLEAAAGHTSAHTGAEDRQLYIKASVSVSAPDKGSVTVTVRKADGNGNTVSSASEKTVYPLGTELTEKDIEDLASISSKLVEQLGIDTAHYIRSGDIGVVPGSIIETDLHYTLTYRPKSYVVRFIADDGEPMNEQYFTYDSPRITLTAPDDPRSIYRYEIGGNTVLVKGSDKAYTFTVVNDELFPEGVCTVIRTQIDSYSDFIIGLVNDINRGIIDSGITYESNGKTCAGASLLPAKDADGNISIIMRVPLIPDDKTGELLTSIVSAIFASPFDAIAINGRYLREGGTFSLDAAVAAFLESGISLDTLSGAILPDGRVNETAFPEELSVSGEDPESKTIVFEDGAIIAGTDKFGALLSSFDMNFASGYEDEGINVRLYLTLEDQGQKTKEFADMRKNILSVGENLSVSCSEGRMNITDDMSDGFYQLYMACMILLGYTDISALSDVESVTAMHFFIDMIKPLVADKNFTANTVKNTFAKLGYQSDISKFERYFPRLCELLNELLSNSTFTDESGEGGVYKAVMRYDVKPLLEKMNIVGTLSDVIKEKESGVSIPVSVDMTNGSSEYQAVVLSASSNGLFGFGYVKDIAGYLPELKEGSKVMLLKDIDASLTFEKKTTLDLNGKTLNGSLTANAKLTVTDSTRDTFGCGGVTGELSGDLKIRAGRYTADAAQYVEYDHVIDEGVVHSRFYTIDRTDGCMNVRIVEHILESKLSLETIFRSILSQAPEKIILDHIADSSMSIDGKEIYSIEYDDILSIFSEKGIGKYSRIFEGFDLKNTAEVLNRILGSLLDYKTVAANISAGRPIADFEYSTKSWKAVTEVKGSGSDNYIAFGVCPGDDNGGGAVKIYMQTPDDNSLAELFSELGDMLEVEAEIDIKGIKEKNGGIVFEADAKASLSADFSDKPEYAVVMALMLASHTEDEELRSSLINAITVYYTKDSTDEIKNVVDNMKVNEVFGALKKEYISSDLREMLDETGLIETVGENAADLQHVFDIMLSSVIALFSKMDVGGSDKLFGSLQVYGSYGLYYRNTSATYSFTNSYGDIKAGFVLDFESVKILAKFFENKITVTSGDGKNLYNGSDLEAAFAAAENGSTVTVKKNLPFSGSVDIPFNVILSGTEKISFGDAKFRLTHP
ncbi:MAG: hypothetical protein IJT91_06065, partial [Clostridia bacterium]|nr:hypothetical protein [Clostridia bacterium]